MDVKKTDAEIRALAMDLIADKIMTFSMVVDSAGIQSVPLVFLPLTMMGKEDADWLKDCGEIYEYRDKAGPRSVNGLPCFLSFQFLSKEDSIRFYDVVEKMVEALKAVPVGANLPEDHASASPTPA